MFSESLTKFQNETPALGLTCPPREIDQTE